MSDRTNRRLIRALLGLLSLMAWSISITTFHAQQTIYWKTDHIYAGR
jgi:hypothetical protein